tara:strand:- start:14 stop:307 length:294 start_codon:yes stop_codon:yes gene_type:complete
MNNLQSLQYFLPEFLIIITALFIIVFDLISLRKYNDILISVGLIFIALLLYQLPMDGGQIFHGMLINDSFSYYFKWIIFISTASIMLVSKYSKELDN